MSCFSAGIAHYSNGQSGRTFLAEDPSRANVLYGGFSTNYIPIDAGVAWGRIRDGGDVAGAFALRVHVEAHPHEFLKAGMTRELAGEYGQFQVGVGAALERVWRSRGTSQASVTVASRFGPEKESPDWTADLELCWILRRVEGWGAFVRWHLGSDYYNIHFQEGRGFALAGLMWKPGRIARLPRRSATRRRSPPAGARPARAAASWPEAAPPRARFPVASGPRTGDIDRQSTPIGKAPPTCLAE
jgi:hypothetical protein